MLETVEIETGPRPTASVIWLHGLGADGHDFEPVVPLLRVPGVSWRFVFPHAPVRPVTINGGFRMRAWFDLTGLDLLADRVDVAGIRDSETSTRELIARENTRGVAASSIVLAGFSQGGAIALHTGLRYPERLAGLLALSTFLPLQHRVEHEAAPANRATPILVAHGTDDPMVACALGEQTRGFLVARGHDVTWKTYPMEHAVSAEEIADIRGWLAEIFGARA